MVGHIAPPLNILKLGGVRVPILFGNDLLWNNIPYSKGYMKFGRLEPSKIIFEFCVLLVKRCLTQFVRAPPYEILVFLMNFIFSVKRDNFMG